MQNKVKINSGRSLSAIINAVVTESIKAQLYQNSVKEKDLQQGLQEEDEDLSSKKEEPSEVSEKLKTGEVSIDDIIEKLNAIRAGKSFKDEAISTQLSEYIDSLEKPERVALLAFLKGISQIVTGEIDASDAVEPADKEPSIEMKKADSGQKKTIKPNVIKKPASNKKEKPSEEDTSGPVPIMPKK
jgi:hypothetical protein